MDSYTVVLGFLRAASGYYTVTVNLTVNVLAPVKTPSVTVVF